MKQITSTLVLLALGFSVFAQTYFPSLSGTQWDTISPNSLNWCTENIAELNQFLEASNTKGFIILHQGKIVIEEYFNNHNEDRAWYWASAGKTIMATLFGLAQDDGYFSLSDPTQLYLGAGWTNMTNEQEERITLWHHLTMTCGFENRGVDLDCTDPSCLNYREDPGNRWFYHNGGYTLTHDILTAASDQTPQEWTEKYFHDRIGMDGRWLPNGDYGQLYWSTTRSMARYGLLISQQGIWNRDTLMKDQSYFHDMVTTSQDENESYGYLWWLNGKDSHRLPGLDLRINRTLSPNAPSDLYAGMGKNGQFVEIIPSLDLVVVRMGDNPGGGLVPTAYHDEMWEKIMAVVCQSTSIRDQYKPELSFFPNPSSGFIELPISEERAYSIYNIHGVEVATGKVMNTLNLHHLQPGIYQLYVDGYAPQKLILNTTK